MKNFKNFLSFSLIILLLLMNVGIFSVPVLALEKEGSYFRNNETNPLPEKDKESLMLRKESLTKESVDKTFNKQVDKQLELKKSEGEIKNLKSTERTGTKKETTRENYVPGEILVKFKSQKINLEKYTGRVEASQFAANENLDKKEDIRKSNIAILKAKKDESTESIIARLVNDSRIEYIEPNYKRYPAAIDSNDTYKNMLWGLNNTGQEVGGITGTNDADIDAPEAWAISEGGENEVIVAVIDTGVAYNHLDLVSNMWDGSDCLDDEGNYLGGCNHGYDYKDSDKTPMPTDSSHGSHIAGTIGAAKNNYKGIVGVAPNVKIMALKFALDVATEVRAIDFAINNGAKIINASFAGSSFSQAEHDAIERFQQAGGIFVAAAGNASTNNDTGTHLYPSDYDLDNIISVAATDQNDSLTSWSSYGTVSIDVGAPGANIFSTVADTVIFSEDFETYPYYSTGGFYAGGNTDNWWGVGHDGSSKAIYTDYISYYSGAPYEWNANTYIDMPIDLSSDNISGATLDFTIWCDTPDTWTFDDYVQTLYYSNSNWYESNKYNEDSIYLDGGSSWTDLGSVGWYKTYTEDISSYLTDDFRFGFNWVTNSSIDDNLGCTIDNVKITKYSDGSDERYNYGYMQGTSMAAPHVAGLAGLIWGYKPDLTYTEVKDTILSTGDDLSSLAGKTVTGKRINAYNALNSLVPSGTEVSNNITEHTTWTLENSPYHMVDTISVYPDVTLTIEPGVVVMGTSGKYLQIAGTLIARGDENNLITFTSYEVDGSWGGIKFIDSSEDAQVDEDYNYISGSVIEYADISSGLNWDCIRIEGSSPFISHSDVHNCSNGIFIYNYNYPDSSSAIIYSNIIRDIPTGYGIQQTNKVSDTGLVKIINNTINNTGTGIVSRNGQGPYIKNNIFIDKISIESSKDFIIENNIARNTYVRGGSTGVIRYNEISSIGGTAFGLHNSNLLIKNNTFTSDATINETATIRINCLDISNCSTIESNNIYNTSSTGYAMWNWGNVDFSASNNYWGTTNSSEIANKIYDFYDDPSLGKVAHEPFVLELLTTDPVITLLGETPVDLRVGDSYTDAGAIASDDVDGDITANIVTVNPVDVDTVGTYTITYNVSDAAENSAREVTRTVNVSAALSSSKEITSFSFSEGSGIINESAHTIAIEVPYGTDVTALTPTIATSTGATVSPASGTAQNFTSPVIYTVTAADSSTQAYTVTVVVATNTVSGNITENTTWTLANSPYIVDGTVQVFEDVTLTIEPGVTVKFDTDTDLNIGGELIAIGTADNKITFTSNQDVPAAGDYGTIKFLDAAIDASYNENGLYLGGSIIKFSIIEFAHRIEFDNSNPLLTDSIIRNFGDNHAIYINDSSNINITNNVIENHSGTAVYVKWRSSGKIQFNTIKDNGNGIHVDLLLYPANGLLITKNNISGSSLYGGIILDNIKESSYVTIYSNNIYNNSPYNVFVTRTLSVSPDIDATNNWWGTIDTSSITSKIYDYYDDISLSKVIYEPFALEEIDFEAKIITSFSFSEGEGIVNESAHTIAVTVPYGTDVTALTPTIATSTGATVSPASGTAQNFTSPVTYTVTAADSSTQEYVVTVNIAANPAKAITAFSFESLSATGVINEEAKTIAVTVPYGTDVTALVSTFTITGASVKIGGVVQTSGTTANNFTSSVTYTVTAADSTTQAYVVTVTVGINPNIALLAADKAALVDGSIKGGNSDLSNIIVSLTDPLPSTGSNGSTITWASSNTAVVSNDGQAISRPAFADGDTTITLTATLTKGELTDTKAFTLVVLKLPVSTIATVTSGSYTVSTGETTTETITNVPFGVSKSTFLSALTKSESNQVWDDTGVTDPVVTDNNLVVTAQDGTTQVTYTITTSDDPDIILVTADKDALVDDSIKGANADLDNITEALATLIAVGSVNSSEITWASSNTAVVSNDGQAINRPAFADGDTTITLTATLTKGVVTQTKSFTLVVIKLPASTITTITSGTYTVNDDASTIIGIPYATASSTFLDALAKGEPNQTWDISGLSDPVVSTNVLVVTSQSGVTKTYTLTVALNPAKVITVFNFAGLTPNVTGIVDESTHTIALTVPYGTDVTSLTPTIATSTGATVSPASGTAQNFTSPVTYTVTAENSSTQNYVVTVTVVADNIAPILSEITSIVTPTNDNTPSYTFNTNEAGIISYSGGCTSVTTDAVSGDNLITFSSLAEGTYDNCSLTVTDALENESDSLSISTFVIDNTAPSFSIGTPSTLSTNSGPINYIISYGASTCDFVISLSSDDITLNTTGTAIGTIAVSGGGGGGGGGGGSVCGSNRTVMISNITGNGTLGISIVAATASDTAGNTALATGPSTTFIVDNIVPTVTKIGDDSADVTIVAGVTATLTFSEALSTAGKTAVENALTAGADEIITYDWSGGDDVLTITGHATDLTTFANDVIVNVSDVAGNIAELLLIDSGLTTVQTTPDGSGNIVVSTTTPQVVITNPTQTVNITVGSGINNPTVNVSSFISGGTGTLPAINITSANANNATVAISASTVVTSADNTWNGIIAAPTVTTVAIPETSGQTKTFSTAIEIGFTGAKLSFDKAVRILLVGQAGKKAGYVRTGTAFTEITTACIADTQVSADAQLTGSIEDCKIDVGSDLIIWTKHFTSFATYTQTAIPAPVSSGGGGGGGSSVILPTNYSIKINDNATSTDNRNVKLTLAVTNATLMAISNEPTFAGTTFETFITTKDWTLTEGIGQKIVYIRFRSSNGRMVDTSASINLTTSALMPIEPQGEVLGVQRFAEGALIRAINDIDIYIVKYVGTKQFKRLILSPSVFNSYQHLNWDDVLDVDKSVIDSFITSELVRTVNETEVYKLYPSGDTGQKRWVKTGEGFNRMGFDWDAVYEINATDRDSYITDAVIE